ncbi:hypothetical protein ZWY2020_017569 [Hordeum vulgare]|nr:hypothetical protein ZWY2020_017569 [Hordeum vulgare]
MHSKQQQQTSKHPVAYNALMEENLRNRLKMERLLGYLGVRGETSAAGAGWGGRRSNPGVAAGGGFDPGGGGSFSATWEAGSLCLGMTKNVDGTKSLESNARFVQWKDGSMQLLIGDVALDVSVEESTQHTHLFRKNGKGLLQSQGRLLQKMRIMPPGSSSSSHSSLTAPVDSQNKKTIEVQTWYDKKDPERMKQERERDESASSWYNPHGRVVHTGFEHDMEFEALAQGR